MLIVAVHFVCHVTKGVRRRRRAREGRRRGEIEEMRRERV
jgi:hypothetical protein